MIRAVVSRMIDPMTQTQDGNACQRVVRFNEEFGWWEFRCESEDCAAYHRGWNPVSGGEEEALVRYFRHRAGYHLRRIVFPGRAA